MEGALLSCWFAVWMLSIDVRIPARVRVGLFSVVVWVVVCLRVWPGQAVPSFYVFSPVGYIVGHLSLPVRLAWLNRPYFPLPLSSSSPVFGVLPVGLSLSRILGAQSAASIRRVFSDILAALSPELRDSSRVLGAVRFVCVLVSVSGCVCLGLRFCFGSFSLACSQ